MTEASTSADRRTPIRLGAVQRRRKLALLAAGITLILGLPFIRSLDIEAGAFHEGFETAGLALILIAIIGRSWCTLYIGGRKSHEVVATGPYSVSRNPLYLFSLVAVAGIGLQTGSLTMAAIATAIAFAIFHQVILHEEHALTAKLGEPYTGYCRRVPRFGPTFNLWRDAETISVHPSRLHRTFAEALLFLLAIPVCETIEKLQDAGFFVPLLHLP